MKETELESVGVGASKCPTDKEIERNRVLSFLWQHLWLLVSLYVMTFGVALCIQSCLGSGVISTIPFVMSLAGEIDKVPSLTVGEYTYIMNGVLVALQILILRRDFELAQLLQLVIGFCFGYFLDINMAITSLIVRDSIIWQTLMQIAGCTVLASGIAAELRCGSVTMPGEGITIAISRVTGAAFPKTKVIVDTTMVVCAVVLSYVFFGYWQWSVVGPGTLFAMVYVGMMVRFVTPKLKWFDRILSYNPQFHRYIYGLARFIYTSGDADKKSEDTTTNNS